MALPTVAELVDDLAELLPCDLDADARIDVGRWLAGVLADHWQAVAAGVQKPLLPGETALSLQTWIAGDAEHQARVLRAAAKERA